MLIRETDYDVITLDKLTYAASIESLASVMADPRHRFVQGDIADGDLVRSLFEDAGPSAVVHLAAETHVDRSIDSSGAFVRTNVVGTHVLLEESLRYWRRLPRDRADRFRFIHVSTDEVFGS